MTDCGALAESSEPTDATTSAADGLNAGTDLNCGHVFDHGVASAISRGLTTPAALNQTIERTFRLMMRAGYFDPVSNINFNLITVQPRMFSQLRCSGRSCIFSCRVAERRDCLSVCVNVGLVTAGVTTVGEDHTG